MKPVEHLPLNRDKRKPGRVALDDEHIVGEVFPCGTLRGLRTCLVGSALRAIAWTRETITVCNASSSDDTSLTPPSRPLNIGVDLFGSYTLRR